MKTILALVDTGPVNNATSPRLVQLTKVPGKISFPFL
jgi:hypothetical protein